MSALLIIGLACGPTALLLLILAALAAIAKDADECMDRAVTRERQRRRDERSAHLALYPEARREVRWAPSKTPRRREHAPGHDHSR